MTASKSFSYVALRPDGSKTRGMLHASTQDSAYSELSRQGLTPLALRPVLKLQAALIGGTKVRLSNQALTELLFDLGALVEAGTTVRAALQAVARQGRTTGTQAVARALELEISAGRPLDEALTSVLGDRAGVAPGLVAAGEASGAIGPAFNRAAAAVERSREIREGLISALSYPVFVLVLSASAILVLLLFVVPSLAPILEQSGQTPPVAMRVMMSASKAVTDYGSGLLGILALMLVAVASAWRIGVLSRPAERFFLDGPFAPICRALVFGQVSLVLGSLIGAGVPVSEALHISSRTSRFGLVRDRFDAALKSVREGLSLSEALAQCKGMPRGVVHLAAIGEEAGSLGAMIERAAGIEQARALRRLKAMTQWLGPALIVGLGLLVGLMMGGLLSAISGLGDIAAG